MDDLIDKLAHSIIEYVESRALYETFYQATKDLEPTQDSGRAASNLIGQYSRAHGEIARALNELIYRQLLEYGLLAPENEER